MADPQTPNRGYNVPITGSDVGTWGESLNANAQKIDNNLGGVSTITLGSTNVALTPEEAQYGTLVFTGVVVGDITVTFPVVQGWWVIGNLTTGAGTFAIAAGGAQVIYMPPGEFVQICIDGSQNPQFMNLGRIGSYIDLAVAAVPSWISKCTVPPYLNCTGATFSSATYPILTSILGGTTLPDYRGRARFYLNQTTGRITTPISGIDGNTLFASGGNESLQEHFHTGSGTTDNENQYHTHHGVVIGGNTSLFNGGENFSVVTSLITGTTSTEDEFHTHDIDFTTDPAGTGNSSNMPPAVVGGITLIRAA